MVLRELRNYSGNSGKLHMINNWLQDGIEFFFFWLFPFFCLYSDCKEKLIRSIFRSQPLGWKQRNCPGISYLKQEVRCCGGLWQVGTGTWCITGGDTS